MHKTMLGVVGAWLVGATQLFAQAAVGTPQPDAKDAADPASRLAPASTPAEWRRASASPDCGPYRVWAQADYLLWWVKNTPLPVPIVTTGNPNTGFPALNTAGGIGQPGTVVLLGDGSRDLGTFSGMRFTLGGWIDSSGSIGAEASGFLLERRATIFSAASNGAGNPPLYFPRFNPAAGFEDAVPIADPLRLFAGAVNVASSLRLWGTEANAAVNLWRLPGTEFTVLAGFRYVDLLEHLEIQNLTTDLLSGNVAAINDVFATRNQFYGGQLGARLSMQRDRFSLDVTGKVALGDTHEVVNIAGSITQYGPNALVPPGLGTSPGGLYAQPSNIGRFTADRFSVIPSVELKLGYQITERLRGYVGYDFMYWNQVVRPGNQINHSVNLTQNVVLDPNGVGTLVGPAQPSPLFNRSDFWAQGVSLGLEFRY